MFYLDLFRTLQDEKVDYVVVGGLAINLHGVERATMDVDLVLAMDEGNLRRFLTAAIRLKLKPMLPVPLESLCDEKQRDAWIRDKTGTGRKQDASDVEALKIARRVAGEGKK